MGFELLSIIWATFSTILCWLEVWALISSIKFLNYHKLKLPQYYLVQYKPSKLRQLLAKICTHCIFPHRSVGKVWWCRSDEIWIKIHWHLHSVLMICSNRRGLGWNLNKKVLRENGLILLNYWTCRIVEGLDLRLYSETCLKRTPTGPKVLPP